MKCPNCAISLSIFDTGKKTQRQECGICGFNVPGNTKQIDEFYCWLSVDDEGREGMVAVAINGVHMVAQHSVKEMALRLQSEISKCI